MKRKLVKQGPQSLVVSMPSEWIKKNKLKKGEEVELQEISNNIVVSGKEIVEPKVREPYVLNIEGKYDALVKRYLTMLYRLGYEEIIITFTKQKIKRLKREKNTKVEEFVSGVSNRFIGMEIISSEKHKIVLKCFTNTNIQELKSVQRRIFLLILSFMENMFDKKYDSQMAHDNVAKFINYFFRLLNATPEASLPNKELLYGFFLVQDRLIDYLQYTHQELCRVKTLSKRVKKILQELFDLYEDYYHLFYKFKEEDKVNIIMKRFELAKKIKRGKFTLPETKILYEAKFILVIFVDFYEVLVGKEL
tara:strand:+ start:1525 stop:2442 length:918 start_codon:yes stop_codon:yes gene_type:complete